MKRMLAAALLLFVGLVNLSSAQQVYGEMKLIHDQGYLLAETAMPDGGKAWFAVDLAVATTSVSKAWLGDRAQIQKQQGRINSDEGRTYFALGGVGFSGDASGKATIPEMIVGGLNFPQASVTVLEQTPVIADRKIAGIIGTDLLRRAEIAVFYYGSNPRLQLKSKGRPSAGAIELPMTVVNGYIVVKAAVNGNSVDVLLDNGSPESWFPVKTLRLIGASATPNSTRKISTLDGAAINVRASDVKRISFAGKDFEKQIFGIAELGVFSRIPENLVPVLLGNSFFENLDHVEINFADNMVRMKAR